MISAKSSTEKYPIKKYIKNKYIIYGINMDTYSHKPKRTTPISKD